MRQPTPRTTSSPKSVHGFGYALGAWALLAALFVSSATGLGCAPKSASLQARNLLLISIDTLRADRLGSYGYERATSPQMDALAEQGTLFEHATAPSPWTLPSHASMFTGLSPKRHGAKGLKSALASSAIPLAETLQAAGFQTHAIVSSTILQSHGLERGFDTLELVDTGGPEPSAVTRSCIEWLDRIDTDERFFLLAHYIDPHTDYGSNEPFRSRFERPYAGRATGIGQQIYRAISGGIEFDAADIAHLSDLYDGGVAQVDAQVGLLLEHIDQMGLAPTTLILVK